MLYWVAALKIAPDTVSRAVTLPLTPSPVALIPPATTSLKFGLTTPMPMLPAFSIITESPIIPLPSFCFVRSIL